MEKWAKFAALEGVFKAFNRMLHKFLGGAAGSAVNILPIVVIQSLVQSAGGFLLAYNKRESLFPGWRALALLAVFGANAALMTFLSYLIFTYEGADAAIATFFVTASIVTDAIAGRLFFRERLTAHQILGVAAFIGAGYAILNFPSLSIITEVAPWVLLSLAIALLLTVNEIVMSASSKLRGVKAEFERTSPFVKNGWIGLTTCLLIAVIIFLVRDGPVHVSFFIPESVWPFAVIIGASTLAMISFKSLSYDTGASLALKKLVMMETFLVLVIIGGVIFYGEPPTLGKFIGALGFIPAFLLMQEKPMETLRWLYARVQKTL